MGKPILSHKNMVAVISSRSASDDHESLGVGHEQTSKVYTSSLNAGSLSAMSSHSEGFHSERDVYTKKYITQWKLSHSM